jgi:hypothetical protein
MLVYKAGAATGNYHRQMNGAKANSVNAFILNSTDQYIYFLLSLLAPPASCDHIPSRVLEPGPGQYCSLCYAVLLCAQCVSINCICMIYASMYEGLMMACII